MKIQCTSCGARWEHSLDGALKPCSTCGAPPEAFIPEHAPETPDSDRKGIREIHAGIEKALGVRDDGSVVLLAFYSDEVPADADRMSQWKAASGN